MCVDGENNLYVGLYHTNTVTVTVPVCFTFNSCFPEIDIKTEHNFKSTLNLANIHLETYLAIDVCLGMHMNIQTLKTLFFISSFSPRPSYAVQYSWISVLGKAAYRHTEYGSGESGKKDTDIVFVEK